MRGALGRTGPPFLRRTPLFLPTCSVVIISCSSPAVCRPAPAARSRCSAASTSARCWRSATSCRSSSLAVDRCAGRGVGARPARGRIRSAMRLRPACTPRNTVELPGAHRMRSSAAGSWRRMWLACSSWKRASCSCSKGGGHGHAVSGGSEQAANHVARQAVHAMAGPQCKNATSQEARPRRTCTSSASRERPSSRLRSSIFCGGQSRRGREGSCMHA